MEHSDDTRLVTISGAEYDLLSQASAELTALKAAEVDRWGGYAQLWKYYLIYKRGSNAQKV